MPPASANNTTNANAVAKEQREEKLREALRHFIQKEKQRKKEEFEAKLEEDRQRKEREARERQNDMTLDIVRGQITKLEQKLTELHNQKQQLFLQLKKVLNEDENRKKQQKDNEYAMMQVQAQQVTAQPQVFLPPVRVQHHQMPVLTKPQNNPPVKRVRSPSPTQQSYYKQTNFNSSKHDDSRRGSADSRVLWNKPHTQYQTPGTLFYQTNSGGAPPQPTSDNRGPAIIYTHLPLRPGYHLELPPTSNPSVSTSESQGQKQVYHINLDQPPISQSGGVGVVNSMQSHKPQITMEKIPDRYHVEVKHDVPPTHGPPPHQLSEGFVYIPNMPMHPMQISAPPQNSKPGANLAQYTPGRSSTVHDAQMPRQPVNPGQSGQQAQQPLHYQRRMY